MDLSPDEDNFPGRLLHQAALWDNLELVQELVTSGVSADSRDSSNRSALHAAALAERSRCLAALCTAGADVNAQSDAATGAKTALHIAAERGHLENVRTLLAAGADISVLDARGDSALALAETNAHRHAANALRDHRDAVERERLSQHMSLREAVSRGEVAQLRALLAALGPEAGLVANLTPAGANTLLYMACESGSVGAVSALVSAGADGRAHPVTRYGPLYAAACHGHTHIANILLQHFPEAVQQETVERWLPLHAACIGGHAAMVTLLLQYPYPEHVLSTYTDARGVQYRFPFDVNSRDARDQTALYIACTLGAAPAVDALLAHCVPALRPPDTKAVASASVVSPARSGISLGIHAIVAKLTGAGAHSDTKAKEPAVVRPVRTDVLRREDSCVACAARAGHAAVVARLLAAGAPADAPAAPPDPSAADSGGGPRRRSRSACAGSASPTPQQRTDGGGAAERGGWSALAAACAARHVQVAELLLAHGATDPHNRALAVCVQRSYHDLVAKILATKALPDPEHKLNKECVSEHAFSRKHADSLTYAALCPATAVLLNWRRLDAHISTIRMSWLSLAAQRVNRRLSSGAGALLAITRLELADNQLRLLPHQIFQLRSLRYLNVAQNKLERLPAEGEWLHEEDGRRTSQRLQHNCYTAPKLQEIYLQDNRLEAVPGALLRLPALATLDVSNNKLRALPAALWAAPALRDLNLAFNLLRDLPAPEGDGEPPPARPVSAPAPSRPISMYSRSPSVERGAGAGVDMTDDVPLVADRAGNAVCSEARRVHSWRSSLEAGASAGPEAGAGAGGGGGSVLHSLNLSHNQFSRVPPPLACRAPSLAALNMAYNSLRSMSYVTSYPMGLRQLDLSHNEITCWPSLPQVENLGSGEGDPLACYCVGGGGAGGGAGPVGGGAGVRAALLAAACPARRRLRLEALRTLASEGRGLPIIVKYYSSGSVQILSNNLLTRIQLTTDDDGYAADACDDTADDDDDEWGRAPPLKGRLLFPLLSMLDVSYNMLRGVPPAVHHLANLSVLNISGNKEIRSLPPQLGLLSRLWSLSAGGCSLGEPLRGMLRGRRASSDVVGYLRSVLTAATPYARMKLMLVGHQGIGKTSLLECLRHESALQHRRKPTEHWSKRMGNKCPRGNMSTVGVDIGLWVYERPRAARGPVTFRTWDFGGQHEYYATHQYFLSKRSLYLVLWKVTDGKKGLAGALNWLRSIQARAPGSPVIMVATHYDQVANSTLPESESPEALQRLIRSGIMGAPDADKLGLPKVMDSLEVSCSTRHNIRLLADIIYSVAFSVKPPGSKVPLLEQLVPASYVALEECVTSLAADLAEPVLRHHDYKAMVTQYMQQKNHKMFRDAAELNQATMFLHENGVLLHYDDANLKELYFLRPQWLCDVLAHVVTVREVNPFATNGVMKVEDLSHVFKASPVLARGDEALGLALLNKFELALCWDQRVLLVPPLLPPDEPPAPQLWLRGRGRRLPSLQPEPSSPEPGGVAVSGRAGGRALRRLLVLTYAPGGLWPRLCARLLADATLASAPFCAYSQPPGEAESTGETGEGGWEGGWGWRVWASGAALCCGALTLLRVTETTPHHDALLPHDNDAHAQQPQIRYRVRQEGAWCPLEARGAAWLEVLLPAEVAVVRRTDGRTIAGYQSISLEPNPQVLAKVLAVVSDHVDLLLEDWYPSLGTRFVHTSEGRCLITRIVPCPACLKDVGLHHQHQLEPGDEEHIAQLAMRRLAGEEGTRAGAGAGGERARRSQDSRASDADSGVGADSNASSRLGSVEGVAEGGAPAACAWTVEQCILAACTGQSLACPRHGPAQLRDVAPDTLLLDLEERQVARWEHIKCSAVAGRGAFGTVLSAEWRPPAAPGAAPSPPQQVALKALQPVPPPPDADLQAQHAYKASVGRWSREPAAAACRAYCALRQELGVLARLQHAHVVPLRAACAAPLALLLARAPLGSLERTLRARRGAGARLGARCARALLLQTARALEYLHDHRIVYRDLKSENVLVWRLPALQETEAAETSPDPIDVHVKLGDYGISRLSLPSGTKGFGGTEGFMAPEIMRYNGEQEYNEKVDCFSFGMLVYEVVTCRLPFEGHDAVKEAVLEGARPPLAQRDVEYPCSLLEVMRRCWSGSPALRPPAAALVSALGAPDCLPLRDVAPAGPRAPPAGFAPAAALPVRLPEEGAGGEVWFGAGEPERAHSLQYCARALHFTHHCTLRIPPDNAEPVLMTAVCTVGKKIWIGDSQGRLSVYCAASCALEWGVRVQESVGGAPSAVAALQPLPAARRVALALRCGRLFLVMCERPPAEGSFVLTELGVATELRCLAAVPTSYGYSVWAGGDGLCAYAVSGAGATAAEGAPAPPRLAALAVLAAHTHVVGHADAGTCVYQWDVTTKQQIAKLDCSKLVPCSESLQSMAIDEELTPERCQVTAVACAGRHVVVGTAWGCLVVADGALRPLAVLRPHDADVRAIVPLPPAAEGGGALFASFGSGYRPLLQRYAPLQPNKSNPTQYSGYFCLLWKSEHWIPD